jgi:hypothetical protein
MNTCSAEPTRAVRKPITSTAIAPPTTATPRKRDVQRPRDREDGKGKESKPPHQPHEHTRERATARNELVLALVGVTVVGVSTATVGVTEIALAAIVPVALRNQTTRRASRGRPLGIRFTSLLATVRIPWSDVRSLEPRGTSAFTQRIVVITPQGRERRLWVVDHRVPVSRDTAWLLVSELETVRRSATPPT